jgi:transmembrane sensor
MSNIHQLHEHVAVEEQRIAQASDWIAKLDRGLSSVEQHQLKQWLAQDSANMTELIEVAKLWDKLEDLRRLADLFPAQQTTTQTSKSSWKFALAATVLLSFSILVYQTFIPLYGKNDSTLVAMQASYQTGIGESNVFILPDKSKLTLNTNSFVQIKYSKNARVIELQRGEINIEVAHNKARPLSVIAGKKVIQAVGTAFNVDLKDKLVELIVTDGKVLVAEKTDTTLKNDLIEAEKKLPKTSMAVSKGEKINLDLTGSAKEVVQKVDAIEIAASLSWRSGNLIFRGESLEDAMAEISRYTNISFELVNDEKLKQVKIAGMFKTGDVSGLLAVLKQNFNITNERIAKDRIILRYASTSQKSTNGTT